MIYEAEVVDIELIEKEDGGFSDRKIKVRPIHAGSAFGEFDADEIEATPPTTIPTSITGSGGTATPGKGQRCLVYYDERSSKAHIIRYMQEDSVGSSGLYSAEEAPHGAIVQKIGGIQKSVFTMAPQGLIELYSDAFASFRIKGDEHRITLKSKIYERSFAGGFSIDTREENEILPSDLAETKFHRTSHLSVFQKFDEKRSLSDATENKLLESEETPVFDLSTEDYTDKVIIRAGTIYNRGRRANEGRQNHVYQLETRQATNRIDKRDTFTNLRIGLQKANKRYVSSSTEYPEGTMLEWTAKRLHPTSTYTYNSFVFRYGQYKDNVSGDFSENTQGEIYRLQMYNNAFDSNKEGKGYEYIFDNTNVEEQYAISFGKLSSMSDDNLKNSFYRKHIHKYDSDGNVSLSEHLGGKYNTKENIFVRKYLVSKNDDDKFIFTENLEKDGDNGVYKLQLENKKAKHVYSIEFKDGILTIKLDTKDAKTTPFITMDKTGKIIVNPGTGKIEKNIYIGGESFGQQLVTRSWVEKVFDKHLHPTAGTGPPSMPIPMPILSIPNKNSFVTYITNIE